MASFSGQPWKGRGISWTTRKQPHQHLITQFLQAGCSSWHPTDSVKTLKANWFRYKITTVSVTVTIRLAWQVPGRGHQEWHKHQNILVRPPASILPTRHGKVLFSALLQQCQRHLGFPRHHAAVHWGWPSGNFRHQAAAPAGWQAWCDSNYQSRAGWKRKSEHECNNISLLHF